MPHNKHIMFLLQRSNR